MKKSMAIIILILSIIVLLTSIACFAQGIYLETLNAKTQLTEFNVYAHNVWALTLSQYTQCTVCLLAGALGGLLAILGLITGVEFIRVL